MFNKTNRRSKKKSLCTHFIKSAPMTIKPDYGKWDGKIDRKKKESEEKFANICSYVKEWMEFPLHSTSGNWTWQFWYFSFRIAIYLYT